MPHCCRKAEGLKDASGCREYAAFVSTRDSVADKSPWRRHRSHPSSNPAIVASTRDRARLRCPRNYAKVSSELKGMSARVQSRWGSTER